MLTTPVTTPHFHSRVLALLSSSLSDSKGVTGNDVTLTRNASPIVVSPLTPADTPLTPEDTISQMIAVTSSWIDLSSPDPIISDISRQVLRLELSYAAFCGITYVVIPGPRMKSRQNNDGGLAQYARSVLDGLSQGPYMQLYIWLPMIDHSEDDHEAMGDLATLAREQYQPNESASAARLDLFGTWEAWDIIRSVCKYSSRLFVGMLKSQFDYPRPLTIIQHSRCPN
jgi:type II protein arginine methyltransferase